MHKLIGGSLSDDTMLTVTNTALKYLQDYGYSSDYRLNSDIEKKKVIEKVINGFYNGWFNSDVIYMINDKLITETFLDDCFFRMKNDRSWNVHTSKVVGDVLYNLLNDLLNDNNVLMKVSKLY